MARLVEYTFHLEPDTGDSSLVGRADVANGAAECKYPALNPAFQPGRRRRYCWTNACGGTTTTGGGGWLDGIQKVDMEGDTASRVVTFGEGCYAGAPAFVPPHGGGGGGEDEGFIVATVYRSFDHVSDVVVLDARKLDTLCRMELEDHVPYHFHSDFVAEVTIEFGD